MLPWSSINVGDTFSNPAHRGYGALSGLVYLVVEKNEEDKLVKVQSTSYADGALVGLPMWRKPSHRMFSEHWRE